MNISGAALKHVGEKVFTSDSGMRRNVPKVLVVVTDGRSQDDVKKSASKLQHSGDKDKFFKVLKGTFSVDIQRHG